MLRSTANFNYCSIALSTCVLNLGHAFIPQQTHNPVVFKSKMIKLMNPLVSPDPDDKLSGIDTNNLIAGGIQLNDVPYSLASKLNVSKSRTDFTHPIEVVGHRGSLYTALENTSRSFIHAAEAGADAVELDVFLLKCGKLVVFHGTGTDEKPGLLDLYCGVEGSILDYTAEDARKLLTFNKNFEEFGCGPSLITHPDDLATEVLGQEPVSHYCYVHTLEEVLTTLRDHPCVPSTMNIKIELKGEGTAAPSVDLVKRLGMAHRCQYSSFDHSRIAEIRVLSPNALTGALFASNLPEDFVQRALAVGASHVHLKYDTCTFERIQEAHDAGLGTMAWFRGPIGMVEDTTLKYHDVGNEDESMYELVLRTGVGSMCVNRPDVMVRLATKLQRRISWNPKEQFEEKKMEIA